MRLRGPGSRPGGQGGTPRRALGLVAIATFALIAAGCASSPGESTAASIPPDTGALTTISAPGHRPTTTTPVSAPATPVTVAPAGSSGVAALLAGLPVAALGAHTGYSRAQFGPAWADVDHNGCDTRNDILNRDLTGRTWRAGTHNCVVITGTLADPYTGRTIVFTKANADAVQIDHVVALSDAWSTGARAWSTTRQIEVKAAYGLWVTPAERAAMSRVLSGC